MANLTGIDQAIRQAVVNPQANNLSGLPITDKQRLQNVQTYDDLVAVLKDDAKLDDATAHHVASTTVFAEVEKSGLNPLNWFPSLPVGEQSRVKYGPDQYNNAIRYFTSWASLQKIFFLLAVASGIAIVALGLPEALAATAAVRAALLAGEGAAAVANLVKIYGFMTLPKLLVPGIVSALSYLGFQFAQTQQTASGDLLTYVPLGVSQAQDKLDKLKGGGSSSGSSSYVLAPKTRITMSKQSKPTMFLGTLFSAKVANIAAFERQTDDAITSKDDLNADAVANLNKWLATLPGRLVYTIAISNAPFDENGIKQNGNWVTMSLSLRRISGQIMPIDTILLGPVDPIVYYPKYNEMQSVQAEIPKLLNAQEIAHLDFPTGEFSIVDKTGNVVPITFSGAKDSGIPSYATPTTPSNVFAGPVPAGYDETAYRTTGKLVPLAPASGTSSVSPAPVPTGASASATVTAPAPTPAPAVAPVQPFTPQANSVTPIPPPTPPAPVAPAPAPVVDVGPVGTLPKGYQTRDRLNIRSAPGTSSAILGTLPQGWYGDVFRYGGFIDGYHWYYSQHAGFPFGWIAIEYTSLA